MKTRSSSLLVLVLTLAAALKSRAQITIEHPVSTPVYAAVSNVWNASIASDGNQFLAVWLDGRASHDVYATRIGRDGTVLDPMGIFIAPNDLYSTLSVFWLGDSYVVSWLGSTGLTATRIAADGTIVDPPRPIFRVRNVRQAVSNGNVIVFTTNDNDYVVVDRELRVAGSGSLPGNPTVCVNGAGEFLLTGFHDTKSGSRIFDRLRLDPAGRVASSAPAVAAVAEGVLRCHDAECILFFRSATTRHLGAVPYDPDTTISGRQIDLPIAFNVGFDVVPIDSGYLLVTTSNRSLRLDRHGIPAAQPSSRCCQSFDSVVAASNGGEVAVLRRSATSFTVNLIPSSDDSDSRDVSISANAQSAPAIAGNGTNYLLTWIENDGIYAGRISSDGTILDGRGHMIRSRQGEAVFNERPVWSSSVAFDGSSYIAAVSSAYNANIPDPKGLNRKITTVRIDPANGSSLATNTTCGNEMRIASNGSETAGAWIDCDGNLAVAFLDANGAIASTPVIVATSQLPEALYAPSVAMPSLAWNGTEWLVTWEKQHDYLTFAPVISLVPLTEGVAAARLSRALAPLDTEPIPIVSRYLSNDASSHVASDGHDFLITWSDGTTIYARRVSASGETFPEQQLAAGARVGDLRWDGAAYALAYVTGKGNMPLLRLRQTGQPFETLVIDGAPGYATALISPAPGRVIAAYSRVAREPLYGGVQRVFVAAPRPARERAIRTEVP